MQTQIHSLASGSFWGAGSHWVTCSLAEGTMHREVSKAPNFRGWNTAANKALCRISPATDVETESFVFCFMDHRNWSSVFNLLPGNQTLHLDQTDFRHFVGGVFQLLYNLVISPFYFGGKNFFFLMTWWFWEGINVTTIPINAGKMWLPESFILSMNIEMEEHGSSAAGG